jgi:hypothetical protein
MILAETPCWEIERNIAKFLIERKYSQIFNKDFYVLADPTSYMPWTHSCAAHGTFQYLSFAKFA